MFGIGDRRRARRAREDQARRELEERGRADRSDDDTEELAHQRRADKATYLRRKLDERASSER